MTTGDVRWTAALVHLLRGWRYYVPHFTGFALAGLYAVGLTTWLPEFFRRTYGWPVQRTGVVLALVLIGVGAPSTLAGGWLADVLRARRLYAAPMWIAAFALLLLWPLSVLLPLARTAPEAIGLLVLVTAVLTFPTAVAPTALQLVTPNRMRAQVTAVFLLGNNLIGTGGGPLAVGLVTDVVFGRDAALRYSLATLGAVICPLAALALWLGRKPFAAAARAISAD
jgi:MFS family permease